MYKSKKILILDDEEIVTSTLSTLLNLEGFTDVNVFNSPLVALEFLKLQRPELIISDFIMPEMNGLEFLKSAKTMYPDICMILLTGYADKENAVRAINEVGLYKYIEKPWDNDDLIINIKNGIEKSRLTADLKDKINELNFANAELDRYSKTLEEKVKERTGEIELSNAKLEAVIRNCADGIILLSSDFRIKSANESAQTMFGLSEALLADKNVDDLILSEDNGTFSKKLKTSKSSYISGIKVSNGINGAEIPIEAGCSKVNNEGDYVCVLRDMSSAKEAERLREDFIAALTHDLRTPLLAAIQTLKFFADGTLGELTPKQAMILEAMGKSNRDMLGLVNALLQVYKYEAGKTICVRTDFVINDLIRECKEEIISLAGAGDISLETEIENSEGFVINADRQDLKRMIINLIGNAVNHSPKGGSVKIRASVNDEDFLFSVKDEGPGISREDISKLFKRFSGILQKSCSVGTGLGLYLTKQIAESYKGKVWVESALNKGSEFFFLLPDVIKQRVEV